METKTSETLTKDQVTSLLNYWERIIQNLSQAVERTIGEVAIQKHRADSAVAAAKEMMAHIRYAEVGDELCDKWMEMIGEKVKTPSMADLTNPPEEVIQ